MVTMVGSGSATVGHGAAAVHGELAGGATGGDPADAPADAPPEASAVIGSGPGPP